MYFVLPLCAFFNFLPINFIGKKEMFTLLSVLEMVRTKIIALHILIYYVKM